MGSRVTGGSPNAPDPFESLKRASLRYRRSRSAGRATSTCREITKRGL